MSAPPNPEYLQNLAQAAAWRVRLGEMGAESSEAFEAWLAADSRHAEAWREIQAPWDYFDDHAAAPEMIRARRDALDHANLRQHRRERRPRYLAVAASCTAIALIIGTLLWLQTRPQVYRTALGERRMITLVDGSQITLDSASQVEVRYSRDARKLALLRGQALFNVAHDVERPFSVRARNRTIVATGTAFDVDVLGPGLRVTLLEGHVVVLDDRPAKPARRTAGAINHETVEMQAGEQLLVPPSGPTQLTAVNLEREMAWDYGQIVVDNETLAVVAERVSRYSAKSVVVADPSIAQLRLSGVFDAGDIDGFVDAVTHYLPVEAMDSQGGQISLYRRR